MEEQIRKIAKEHGFRWIDYLVRLANCESSLNPLAINDKGNNPAHSKDRGVFQINNYWHSQVSDECAMDVECATKWTMERINKGYQHEWVCNAKILANK